jgi:Flp pilus assembly pilin Flp
MASPKITTRLRGSTAGGSLIEYGLLTGLVAVVAIASVASLGGRINGTFTTTTAALGGEMGGETGSDGGAADYETGAMRLIYETADGSVYLQMRAGSEGAVIQWAEGVETTLAPGQTFNQAHNYGVAGQYEVSIAGTIEMLGQTSGTSAGDLIEIASWGDGGELVSLDRVFGENAAAERRLPPVLPATVREIEGIFQVTQGGTWTGIEQWDTSRVTNMNYLLYSSTGFSADLSGWDTGSVEGFVGTMSWIADTPFDITRWDTSSATDMYQMFYNNVGMDQDLSGWCLVQNPEHSYFGYSAAPGKEPRWGQPCT